MLRSVQNNFKIMRYMRSIFEIEYIILMVLHLLSIDFKLDFILFLLAKIILLKTQCNINVINLKDLDGTTRSCITRIEIDFELDVEQF